MYKIGEKVMVKLSAKISNENAVKLIWKTVTIKEYIDDEDGYKIEEDMECFTWYERELEPLKEKLIDDDRLDELMTAIINHKEKADIMEALYNGVKLKEELLNIKEGIEANQKILLNLLKS